MIADDRDAEAARTQQVRRAIAVDADQVRHHVGRAAFAAIDEQRHARRQLLFGGGVCAMIASAGYSPDRISAIAAELESVLLKPQLRRPLGLSEQGGNDRRARPGADPDLHAALAAGADAGLRILREDLPGRHLRIDAGAPSSTFRLSPARPEARSHR